MMDKYTERYHELLQETGNSLVLLQKSIVENQSFLQSVFQHDYTQGADKIRTWFLYDIIRIAQYVIGENPNYLSLESFGLVLIRIKLQNPEKEGLLDATHSYTEKVFMDKLHNKAAVSTLNLIGVQKPAEQYKIHLKQEISQAIPEGEFFLLPLLQVVNLEMVERMLTELHRFATAIAKADDIVTPEEESTVKAIYELLHPNKTDNEQVQSVDTDYNTADVSEESLEEILNELNDLIALNEVKEEVNTLINFVRVQNLRKESGLKSPRLSYHLVFTGNPGTGKTIVARIVAKLYKHIGILSMGHFLETDRSGLVANYTGQTATKTNSLIDSALHGVLFIDEAYSLIGQNMDDFGKEAISTLLKRMEDDRERLVVIIAGYPEEMQGFLNANPGLRSRFSRYIHFPDYTPEEMMEIFDYNCRKLQYVLQEAARDAVQHTFAQAYANKDKSFGNGRYVRNLFEKAIENQANRIAYEPNLTREILISIGREDIPSQ